MDIENKDAIFHVLYDLDERFQVPGVVTFGTGRTYEYDGIEAKWRGIYDDKGRIMVAICHNMDLGDAWEWADNPELSGEVRLDGIQDRDQLHYLRDDALMFELFFKYPFEAFAKGRRRAPGPVARVAARGFCCWSARLRSALAVIVTWHARARLRSTPAQCVASADCHAGNAAADALATRAQCRHACGRSRISWPLSPTIRAAWRPWKTAFPKDAGVLKTFKSNQRFR